MMMMTICRAQVCPCCNSILIVFAGKKKKREGERKKQAKEKLTDIFFGLQVFNAVEEDVKTAWQDSLVIGGSCHGVRLARRCDAVGKQQSCKHTATHFFLFFFKVYGPTSGLFPFRKSTPLTLWKTKSKTHKRLKERFLIRRNRTKHANFRCNHLFQATYNTTENS